MDGVQLGSGGRQGDGQNTIAGYFAVSFGACIRCGGFCLGCVVSSGSILLLAAATGQKTNNHDTDEKHCENFLVHV